jgi:hypothetical protein
MLPVRGILIDRGNERDPTTRSKSINVPAFASRRAIALSYNSFVEVILSIDVVRVRWGREVLDTTGSGANDILSKSLKRESTGPVGGGG